MPSLSALATFAAEYKTQGSLDNSHLLSTAHRLHTLVIMQLFTTLAVLAGAIAQVSGVAVPSASTAVFSLATAASTPAATPVVASDDMSVKNGYNLVIYRDKNFKGPYRTLAWGDYLQYPINSCTYGLGTMANAITSYKILEQICCIFYADSNCDERQVLFRATAREDWFLQGAHNDAVNSIKCVYRCD